jgi:hypothetical protein
VKKRRACSGVWPGTNVVTHRADIVQWCASESGFVLEAALLATAPRLPDARTFPVELRNVEPSTLAASGLADPSSSAAAWAATRVHARTWLARHRPARQRPSDGCKRHCTPRSSF